jgi:hypothetical protein
MSGTIRVIDLPDLGIVTDASSIVADKTGTGRFSALAMRSYCASISVGEAPSNNTPYGRMNGAWTPVLPEAPSNGIPFARLNAAWSPVVPEAPLTGSAYGRVNGTWVAVMPVSGGSIAGSISASGNITAGGGVAANQFALSSTDGYEWQFLVQAGTGDHIEQHRAGWQDTWNSASGARRWIAPSGTIMTLDAAGALTTASSVNATQFWSNGAGATVGQFGFSGGGSGRVFQFAPQFYLDYATTGATAGTLQWNVSNGPLWVMRASDDFCFNPQSSVGGNGAYLNVSDRRAKTGIVPTTKGLAEILQLQPVEFDRLNPATGTQHEIGFIAQDVQPIVPEAVWQAGIPLQDGSGGLDSADPTLAMSESTITALNVNAIKELHALIVTLTDRIAALEAA